MGIIIKILLLLMGFFLLCFLAGQVFRSMRRLDRRISEFKEEQKELEEQGRSVPPYVALAQLQIDEQNRRKRKKRRRLF